MTVETINFAELAARYCERQHSTPRLLKKVLEAQREKFQPTGWVLLRCETLDSSLLGSVTIFPYGPNNTLKEPPTRPISPRGLASDMSVAEAVMLATDPMEIPDSLLDKYRNFYYVDCRGHKLTTKGKWAKYNTRETSFRTFTLDEAEAGIQDKTKCPAPDGMFDPVP